MGRLKELDCLRGIACISVLLFHYTTKYSEIFETNLTTGLLNFKFGGIGVDLFFIISGFVIFLTVKNNTNPLEFVFKRFSRLYPIFWICVIITFFTIRHSDLVNYHRSFGELLVNLTMVPDIFGVKRVDGVYWSLLPELAFYFLMFLLLVMRKIKHIDLICFVWLVAIALNSFHDIMPIRVLFNLKFGYFFVIGINFYKLKYRKSRWWNHALIAMSYLVSFFVIDSIQKHIILLTFIFIFYLFAYDRLKWINHKFLVTVGEISYVLYLLHQFIGYFIIYELIELGVNNSIILLLVPTTLMLVLSYFITFYVEKPIVNFLRGLNFSFKK
ncbi:acyltransferase [uncultured Winogradskyella sp.]|uniref:acyltransferase family protein n=1 Tax=uncultured Winogradskyella sp. TaxID=395353 RepID=UPI00263213ED|nr:acyltransferase [uncultured Winogradskyella sp.]